MQFALQLIKHFFNIPPVLVDEDKDARGQADVDIPAIVTALQRTSQLAMDFPHIKELNIDPFIVGRAGTGAVVVDARISLSLTNGV